MHAMIGNSIVLRHEIVFRDARPRWAAVAQGSNAFAATDLEWAPGAGLKPRAFGF